MKILEAKNICYSYENGNFSLKNVSLLLQAGESVALIGPNGAGKTTLVKILAGLSNGYDGEVLIAGKQITEYSNIQRATMISYIPQVLSLIHI